MLFGECLSGALYWNDFLMLARKHGFNDPRLVRSSRIKIGCREIEKKVGNIAFFSATYRLFKIPGLDCAFEDYGQAVVYKGSVKTSPEVFILDEHHKFEKKRVVPVCRNTFKMLHDSRFKGHFDFLGSGEIHYGSFSGCYTAAATPSSTFSMPALIGSSISRILPPKETMQRSNDTCC